MIFENNRFTISTHKKPRKQKSKPNPPPRPKTNHGRPKRQQSIKKPARTHTHDSSNTPNANILRQHAHNDPSTSRNIRDPNSLRFPSATCARTVQPARPERTSPPTGGNFDIKTAKWARNGGREGGREQSRVAPSQWCPIRKIRIFVDGN